MKKLFAFIVLIFLFAGLLLTGCSGESKSPNGGQSLESLRKNALSSALEENPALQKKDIESIVAEVIDIAPFENDQMTVTNKNIDTQETFIIRVKKEEYPSLEEGQTILLVTPKLQRDSHPPMRNVLELVMLNN